MPDGSNLSAANKPQVDQSGLDHTTDVAIRADKVFALVAALDLLEDYGDVLERQADIRTVLTGLAFDEAQELARRARG